ncbi:hypothetical protein [Actinokineospora enzanensis]|uniref:hypothetical protein n=1 Tax=Actinokineospora enzanensis TaxID=155975 RepID=UPI00037C09F8|nr:hypothetical protein [Actinokineospora enzanensis]
MVRIGRVLLVALVLPALTLALASTVTLLAIQADLGWWDWLVFVLGIPLVLVSGAFSVRAVSTMLVRATENGTAGEPSEGAAWICGFALVYAVVFSAVMGTPAWLLLHRAQTTECEVLDTARGPDEPDDDGGTQPVYHHRLACAGAGPTDYAAAEPLPAVVTLDYDPSGEVSPDDLASARSLAAIATWGTGVPMAIYLLVAFGRGFFRLRTSAASSPAPGPRSAPDSR